MNNLELHIDHESVNICVNNGEDQEPTHVCYWHIEEVEEDANVAISMCNAIRLYFENPNELLDRLGFEVSYIDYIISPKT